MAWLYLFLMRTESLYDYFIKFLSDSWSQAKIAYSCYSRYFIAEYIVKEVRTFEALYQLIISKVSICPIGYKGTILNTLMICIICSSYLKLMIIKDIGWSVYFWKQALILWSHYSYKGNFLVGNFFQGFGDMIKLWIIFGCSWDKRYCRAKLILYNFPHHFNKLIIT